MAVAQSATASVATLSRVDVAFAMVKSYVIATCAAALAFLVGLGLLMRDLTVLKPPLLLGAVPMVMLIALPGFAMARVAFYLLNVRHPVAFALAGFGAAFLTFVIVLSGLPGGFAPNDPLLIAATCAGGLVFGLIYGRSERAELSKHA